MVETGPTTVAGPKTGRVGSFAVAVMLLVPATVLAGCIAEPGTELTLRRGDLIQAELVLTNEDLVLPPGLDGSTGVEGLCGHDPFRQPDKGCPPAREAYALSGDGPSAAVEGFADPTPLPQPIIDALHGLHEGEHLVEEDLAAFGSHDPELVQTHTRNGSLPRIVQAPDAYGHTWNTTRLANGSYRIEPEPNDQDVLLEAPDWCNQRFCLFESHLTGSNATRLFVHHQATEGDRVHIEALSTWLTVTDTTNATFTVDGNDPRAGHTYDLYVNILEARGPPTENPRAPGFNLTTINGTPWSLEAHLGQPVVLEFFATWCPSCIKNTNHLNKLETRYADQVAILSVGVDPWESQRAINRFIEANNVGWPVAIDEEGTVSQAYHVGSLSTEVLVSPQGSIVHTENGVADHDRVVAEIDSLLDAGATGSPGRATR